MNCQTHPLYLITPLIFRSADPLCAFRSGLDLVFDFAKPTQRPQPASAPPLNVYNDQKRVVIELLVPGTRKEAISVTYHNQAVSIKGERKNEHSDAILRSRERAFGRFEHQVSLPEPVDPASITSSYKDGVLRIEIPKPAKKEAVKIQVA